MFIIDVCCRWPGSAHDATIFANSTFGDKLDRGDFQHDSLIVADSAYGANYYVCKPLVNPRTMAENRYQKSQIKTRNVAERTFGALKRKFPCLLGMQYNLDKVQDVIVACCVLYNMTKMEKPGEIPTQAERDVQNDIGRRFLVARENQRNPISSRDFLLQHYFDN